MATAGTALAWRWVIETLADAKQVDASVLAELIGCNIEVLKDSSVNERISLRFLEGLLDSDGATSAAGGCGESSSMCVDFPSKEGFTGTISVASRSEDVLCGYLQKVETLVRNNPTDAMYKNELRRFICQKRSALPNSFLEMLEASIDKACNETSSFTMRNNNSTKEIQEGQPGVDDVTKGAGRLLEFSNKIKISPILDCDDTQLERSLPGCQHDYSEVDEQAKCKRNPGYADKRTMLQHGYNTKRLSEGVTNIKENSHPSSDQITGTDKIGGEKASRDEDEIHDATSAFDMFNEIIASEKCKLVSSQNPDNQDSSMADGTQQKQCIKCDEPGQLLVCSAVNCPIAVHEGCLGFTVSFENIGEFYCPFCSYMQAANSYGNARRKVSICRKNLSSFMGWDSLHLRSVVRPPSATSKEPNHPMKDADEIYHVKYAKHIQTRGSVDDVRDYICGKDKDSILFHENNAQTDEILISNRNSSCDGTKSSVENHDGQCKKVLEEQQLRVPALVVELGNLPCHESDSSPTRKTCVDFNSNIEKDHLWLNDHEGYNQDLSCEEKVSSSMDKDAKSIEPNSNIPGQDTYLISVIEKSKKFRKTLKRRKRYANPVYPYSRRNRLPWTTEEEEKLKEAVHKFSDGANGILPWTHILEYGHHVFHKTRQPADLKDKWRNIRNKRDNIN